MTNVMEGLLKADALKCLRANKIVSGTISEIRPDEVAIDIGAKAEGIVPASEFDNLDELSVGTRHNNRRIGRRFWRNAPKAEKFRGA